MEHSKPNYVDDFCVNTKIQCFKICIVGGMVLLWMPVCIHAAQNTQGLITK